MAFSEVVLHVAILLVNYGIILSLPRINNIECCLETYNVLE